MTATLPLPAHSPLEPDAYKHQARLLLAQHSARPVLFDGKENFIQVIDSRLAGGRVDMTVYLIGNQNPIDSSRIALAEPPKE
jgi:hypothetical protein